ncbi:MAG: Crp/Fnr family transcriptional regulator [Muribaculaceae bacterium]|nr:Crp/Fnr family transcriptional regulator [Muribaculaceae bacterium]MDE6503376.1 Crp/Fnr family transcriptional regulator [Muribaculaceae bacterium]
MTRQNKDPQQISIFDTLLSLPLFAGTSRTKLEEIVGNTRFHFIKYTAGQPIINTGDSCSHVKFIISGSVRISISNANDRFTVSQTLDAPEVIAPEYLFGRHTQYPCKATALTDTGIMQISKNDYTRLLKSDHVFMFNFLNMLSVKAQQAEEGIMSLNTGSLDERIAYWITSLTQGSAKDITLTARKRDLYSIFGMQRSSFFAALDRMKEAGMIDYDKNTDEIQVTSRKCLMNLLRQDNS